MELVTSVTGNNRPNDPSAWRPKTRLSLPLTTLSVAAESPCKPPSAMCNSAFSLSFSVAMTLVF